jgi:hypothetical protein
LRIAQSTLSAYSSTETAPLEQPELYRYEIDTSEVARSEQR